MKTEQEQIEAIYNLIISNLFEDTVYSLAKQIYTAGYSDVSEYKAEIERLRQEVRDTDKMARNTIEQYRAENKELENALKQSEDNYSRAFERLKAQEREIERLRTTLGQCNTELNSALESLKSQCREIGALKAGTKQAQIDVLNKVKDSYGLYYLSAFGVKERMLADILNPMIEELKK